MNELDILQQYKNKFFIVAFLALSFHRNRGFNEGISAASFCRQVAALVPDMFCNFYLVKNHKIAKTSTIAKAKEKNKYRFRILRILEIFWCRFD